MGSGTAMTSGGSAISSLMVAGSATSMTSAMNSWNTIPATNPLTLYYDGSLPAGKWISLVEDTMATAATGGTPTAGGTNPCYAQNAAAPASSTHSGPLQAL